MRAPGVVLGGLLAAAAATPAGAEPCAARAEVNGDAAAVARVTAELAVLGVERGTPAPGCRGVVAQVELAEDGGIAVAIRDGSRRSEGRVVSDAAVAASWIDSWLRDDLDGTAWLLASAAPAAAPRVTAPPAARADQVAPAAARTPVLDRVALAVDYEQSWLEDGASASGGGVTGCVRTGAVCLGARARFAREADRTVNLTAMSRGDASVLATASLPLTVGRMTFAPELGLGFGRTSTRRLESCAVTPPMCDPSDPMDPNCQMPPPTCLGADMTGKVYVGDQFSTATYTPRLAAALRVAVPLFEHVWLDGIASIAYGPFAHTAAFAPAAINADGTVPGGTTADQVTLPGESTRALVLGVGLRVGAP